jgi:hypothetical protein
VHTFNENSCESGKNPRIMVARDPVMALRKEVQCQIRRCIAPMEPATFSRGLVGSTKIRVQHTEEDRQQHAHPPSRYNFPHETKLLPDSCLCFYFALNVVRMRDKERRRQYQDFHANNVAYDTFPPLDCFAFNPRLMAPPIICPLFLDVNQMARYLPRSLCSG